MSSWRYATASASVRKIRRWWWRAETSDEPQRRIGNDGLGRPARELLAGNLRDLRILNRYLGSYRSVLGGLARLLREQNLRSFTLLDVGTGSADIPAAIAQWARRRNIVARINGLERDVVTVEQAIGHTQNLDEITIVRGDALAPPFRSGSCDFILASQLLHHFPDEQIIALLRTWARVARRAIIVSDLLRHPLAYHGIRVLTCGFTRNPMTHADAALGASRLHPR